jgi:ribonucleoside-diphosphate reductase alpha chain
VIDINHYPVDKARISNLRHRPIGLGVQGLADTFIKMRLPFESGEAMRVNRMIFETIYHASLEQSMEIAKRRSILSAVDDKYAVINEFEKVIATGPYRGAYATFEGCPASQGILQYDMWNATPTPGRYDWEGLKQDIQKYGLRNSLLVAPMPTASTSQIMGFTEAFEPITSNIYKRKTLAGEFIVINKYLIRDLIKEGLWCKTLKEKIMMEDGSVQNIPEIPERIRELYKVVWEMKQRSLIDMAADRGAFICQSQSMNLFVDDPSFQRLTTMHFYSWNKGLKTGLYYLRTKPKASAQKFTIEPTLQGSKRSMAEEDDETTCLTCSA